MAGGRHVAYGESGGTRRRAGSSRSGTRRTGTKTSGASHNLKREIGAVAVVGAAILAIVSRHQTGTGVVGRGIADLSAWLFGWGADAILGLILLYGLLILFGRRPTRAKRFGLVLGSIILLSALQLKAATQFFADLHMPFLEFLSLGTDGKGGGVIGAVLGFPVVRLFDRIGTEIALGLLGVVTGLLVLDAAARKGLGLAVSGVARFIVAALGLVFRNLVAVVVFIVRGFVDLVTGFAQADEAPAGAQTGTPKRVKEPKRTPVESVDTSNPRITPGPERAGFRALARLVERAEAPAAEAPDGVPTPTDAETVPEPIRIRQYEPQPVQVEPVVVPHGADLAPKEEGAVVYHLPTVGLLGEAPTQTKPKPVRNLAEQAKLLEETLASFGVQAKVVQVDQGPVVTRYELQPAPGVKVSRIVSLADDIALSLAAADVRIEAPIPGKAAVGIEVPNKETSMVHMRDVLASADFQKPKTKLAMALGKDIAGSSVVCDLADMPHLLIAGATGSGKSVCMNTMITSLLFRQTPDTCKMLMVDPKRVELATYDGIPHLLAPVVTDPKKAAGALKWVVEEMEKRYELFAASGVRNIEKYNEAMQADAQPGEPDQTLPFIVVFIDELADLMIVAAADVEDAICRLAQMARAAGIHLVIATQRPSVDVITGLIKANIPSRVAFAVSSQVDSRTILDMAGAERLLGRGDMLFCPVGAPKPVRVQGAYISDKEVETLVEFWKRQGSPEYKTPIVPAESKVETDTGDDELFDDAINLVLSTGSASISMVQRRFRIGYARAARLIDMMELAGIVGPYQGSKPREILVDRNPRG